MIKTIFYFCPTEEEYNNLKEQSAITAKTITFVEDSGSIYINGRRYGNLQPSGYTGEVSVGDKVFTINNGIIINIA